MNKIARTLVVTAAAALAGLFAVSPAAADDQATGATGATGAVVITVDTLITEVNDCWEW